MVANPSSLPPGRPAQPLDPSLPRRLNPTFSAPTIPQFACPVTPEPRRRPGSTSSAAMRAGKPVRRPERRRASPLGLAHQIPVAQRHRPQARADQKCEPVWLNWSSRVTMTAIPTVSIALNGGEASSRKSTLGESPKCPSCTMLPDVADVSGRPPPIRWRRTSAREGVRGRPLGARASLDICWVGPSIPGAVRGVRGRPRAALQRLRALVRGRRDHGDGAPRVPPDYTGPSKAGQRHSKPSQVTCTTRTQ